MHLPIVAHTISVFEQMYDRIPPGVPEDIVAELETQLKRIKLDHDLNLVEVEDAMIVAAKNLWPYTRAFQEMYSAYARDMSESLFLQMAQVGLRSKYSRFLDSGGNFEDLHRGVVAEYFSAEERVELSALLIEIQNEIRKFATQSLTHSDKEIYQEKIEEFTQIMDHIEDELDHLRSLAEREDEHPQLIAEIREHIRAFEHGFAFLGPSVDYEAVKNARGYVEGRRFNIKIRV